MTDQSEKLSLHIKLALALILIINCYVRWGLVEVPLERDEGEYAYGAQLLLEGLIPYKDFYSMKLPGIYVIYAVILKLFGHSIMAIHVGLLIANTCSIMLLFFIARYLLSCSISGIIATIFYMVHNLSSSVQGIFANTEHFMMPFVLSGMLLLLIGLKRDKLIFFLISGLCLGCAILIKQHGASFAIAGIGMILYNKYKQSAHWKHLAKIVLIFVTAVSIPYLVTCLIFILTGYFGNFIYWTVIHAKEYVGLLTPTQGIDHLKGFFGAIWSMNWPIWSLACIGGFAIISRVTKGEHYIYLLIFTIMSFLAVCPGFYFRPHYFIFSLPALSILAAMGVMMPLKNLSKEKDKLRKILPMIRIGVVVLAVTIPISADANYLFGDDMDQVSRYVYGMNPFPESIKVGEYLAANTDTDDRIAIIGSEPQIYFYSQRRGASGYVYMYPMMEPQEFSVKMQRHMISEIEKSKPKYLVYVNVSASWIRRKESPSYIFDWFNQYQQNYYKEVGYVDMVSPSEIHYYWDKDIGHYHAKSQINIVILKRKVSD